MKKQIHIDTFTEEIAPKINKDKCVLVYTSQNLTGVEKRKFEYFTFFVQRMERLLDEGYDTIMFKTNLFDSFALALIEQVIYLGERKRHKLKIYGFTIEYSNDIPSFIKENCTMIHLNCSGYELDKQLFEYLSGYVSNIVGLFRESDRLLKYTSLDNVPKYNIHRPNVKIPKNITLGCTLTAMLKRDHILLPSEMKEIKKILSRVISRAYLNKFYKLFPMESEIQFTLSFPYLFDINEMFNEDFYRWCECFLEIENKLEFGTLEYFFGFNKLELNKSSKWKIGKSVYIDELP